MYYSYGQMYVCLYVCIVCMGMSVYLYIVRTGMCVYAYIAADLGSFYNLRKEWWHMTSIQ